MKRKRKVSAIILLSAILVTSLIAFTHNQWMRIDFVYRSEMPSLWIPAKVESSNRSVSKESTVRASSNSTKFNFEDRDVMVFLHIQKTSGSLFGLHLLDLILPTPCLCWPRTGADLGPKSLQVRHPINPFIVSQRGHSQLVHMCTCPRRLGKDTWLFSRYTTGWKCGVHADWTMLQDCVPDFYKETYNTTNRLYKYVTVMRNPVDRYFSEYEHLHRSFGHGWDMSRSVDSCNDRFVRFFQCFQLYGANSTTLSFKQFLQCPFNPAGNRQTFMLADWSLVPCDKSFTTYQKEEILLSSAMNNLKQLSYFALQEFQYESQMLFEYTFGVRFVRPFTQKTPKNRTTLYSNEETSLVIKKNQLDMRLYKYATDLFWERINDAKVIQQV